jgi:Fic family protein
VSATNGVAADERAVVIGLTQEQVAQVLQDSARHTDPWASRLRLRAGFGGSSDRITRRDYYHDKALSVSVIQGLSVLAVFTSGEEHTTTDVATQTGIPKKTAYRYIRTLAVVGLLELDSTSGLYRLAAHLRTRTLHSVPPVVAA